MLRNTWTNHLSNLRIHTPFPSPGAKTFPAPALIYLSLNFPKKFLFSCAVFARAVRKKYYLFIISSLHHVYICIFLHIAAV